MKRNRRLQIGVRAPKGGYNATRYQRSIRRFPLMPAEMNSLTRHPECEPRLGRASKDDGRCRARLLRGPRRARALRMTD